MPKLRTPGNLFRLPRALTSLAAPPISARSRTSSRPPAWNHFARKLPMASSRSITRSASLSAWSESSRRGICRSCCSPGKSPPHWPAAIASSSNRPKKLPRRQRCWRRSCKTPECPPASSMWFTGSVLTLPENFSPRIPGWTRSPSRANRAPAPPSWVPSLPP